MKKFLALASLTAVATLGFTGCTAVNEQIGVDNPDDPVGVLNMGSLTTRYSAKNQDYIENVFNAAKKALDEMKYYRTGETPKKDAVTIYARAHGDYQITVDIYKKLVDNKDGTKQEWVYVTVRYGTWGNNIVGQQIVSKISANLK